MSFIHGRRRGNSTYADRPNTGRGLKPSVSTNSPCPCSVHANRRANSPHPRTRKASTHSQTGIRPEHALSADSPQSRTVHIRNLITDRNCPRTSTGRELSTSRPRRIRFTAHLFPRSHSNHSSLCPGLIQTQFARRSKNLRPARGEKSEIPFRRAGPRAASEGMDATGRPRPTVCANRHRNEFSPDEAPGTRSKCHDPSRLGKGRHPGRAARGLKSRRKERNAFLDKGWRDDTRLRDLVEALLKSPPSGSMATSDDLTPHESLIHSQAWVRTNTKPPSAEASPRKEFPWNPRRKSPALSSRRWKLTVTG